MQYWEIIPNPAIKIIESESHKFLDNAKAISPAPNIPAEIAIILPVLEQFFWKQDRLLQS